MRRLLLGALLLLCAPIQGQAQEFALPSRRGNYWVCPNGRSIFGGLGSAKIGDPLLGGFHIHSTSVANMKFTYGEIIIGKTASNYNEETINELGKKILMGLINVPTSYRMDSYVAKKMLKEGYSNYYTHFWRFNFTNSAGKELSLNSNMELVRKGKKIEHLTMTEVANTFHCEGDSFKLYIVYKLAPQSLLRNQYGEEIPPPLILMKLEALVKSRPAESQKTYDY